MSSLRLDLGSGAHPREGFTPVDRVQVTPETIVCDLVSGERWPWDSNSVLELASSHFIEHIPADEVETWLPDGRGNVRKGMQDRLLWFFDEAFRVIVPGGLFHLTWPALQSTDAFRDPTHRRFIPLEMLHYLSTEGRAAMGLEHYGTRCNWVTTEARLHGDPKAVGSDAGRSWDVVRAYSVTLRAQK